MPKLTTLIEHAHTHTHTPSCQLYITIETKSFNTIKMKLTF